MNLANIEFQILDRDMVPILQLPLRQSFQSNPRLNLEPYGEISLEAVQMNLIALNVLYRATRNLFYIFEGDPHFGLKIDGRERSMPAEEATDVLLNHQVPRINFQVVLVYFNGLGEAGSLPLSTIRAVEFESTMDFQELYEQSFQLGGYERDIFPEFDLSDIIFPTDVDDLREPPLI